MQSPRRLPSPVVLLFVVTPVLYHGCAGHSTRAAAHRPTPAVPYERIAELVAAGDPEGALGELERTFGLEALSSEARLLRAQLLVAAGRRDEGRGVLLELLSVNPEWIDALMALALLEPTEEPSAAQRELFERVLALDPEHPQALAALGNLAAAGYPAAGYPAAGGRIAGSGDLEAAADYFRRALRREPENFEALYGLGRIALARQQYHEAAAHLEQATRSEASYAFAWVDLARARTGLEDHSGALQALDRAVGLEPDGYWHRIDRGRTLLRLRRLEPARADFARAVEMDPDVFLPYVYRAGLNDQLGRIDEAIEDYESTLRLNPEYTFAHAPLGVLYYLNDRWVEAAAALRRAHRLEPEEPTYALLAALSLKRAGREAEAVGYLNALLPSWPQDSWAHDIGRYLADPAREPHVITRTERERNSVLRRRRLFYIASELLAAGRIRTALTYLSEAARLEARDLPERRIAAHLLSRYGVEEH